MKKYFSTLVIAGLGAGIALLANNYFHKENSLTSSFQNTSPIRYASFGAQPMGNLDFTQAAEQTVNAVVHIKTSVEQSANNLNDPFQSWFFGGSNPFMQQKPQGGSGSGVIISKDGYIVTNNHVIDGADKIEVILNDKRSFKAEVIGTDPQTDLALVKIDEKDLPFLTYGNSDNVKIGEWAIAVGNPFNLTSTVTAGIVSAKGRNINIIEGDPNEGRFPVESFIQTDAAVNPGNSGGALVNPSGELIGINSAIASQTGSYSGYSFAIPVNIVKKVVADLIELGTVQRAFIGVGIRDIDASFAKEKGIKNLNGAYVTGTIEGAEFNGISEGDVITKIESNAVKNVAELQEQISKYRPGNKINVTVMRDGKEKVVPVTLKNKNGDTGVVKKEVRESISMDELGASFENASDSELKKLGASYGVKITELKQGKLAHAGIKKGFIITSIDKKKITNTDDIQDALKNKSGGILIEGVYPNGSRAYYAFGL